VVSRDPDQTVARLRTWLTDVAGRRGVDVDHLEIPASTGFSNETILFDATWDDERGAPSVHRLVARIAPQVHTVFLEANFENQFRVMQALAERTDVPVPDMLWFEGDPAWFGSPFWIMARVDGIAPADAPAESPAQ
jgi:aminoglycoside phosphotransferase (APT) family kinase protein